MSLTNLRPALLALFPLIAIAAILSTLNIPNDVTRWPIELASHVGLRFPFLFGQPAAMLSFFLGASGFIFAFVLAPVAYKKPVVVAASLAFLLVRMPIVSVCVGSIVASALFYSYRNLESRSALTAAVTILAVYAVGLNFITDAEGGGWRLYAQVLVGALGVHHFTNSNPREELKLIDVFIYLCGFHGVFLTLIYSYSAVTASFLKRPYSETAQPSAGEIFGGFSKILGVAAIQIFLFPTWSLATSSASSIGFFYPSVGAINLALLFILFTIAFIVENVGFIQVAQGFSRLFGYDVKVHTNAPWQAVSFLDYWKRNGINTRDYMLTHILVPTYLKTKSLYLGILLVWTFWALVSAVSRGVLQYHSTVRWVPHSTLLLLLLLKFSFLYANLSFIEMKVQPLVMRLTSRFSKWATRLFIFLIYFLVLCIGNELLLVYFSGGDIILEFLNMAFRNGVN